MENFEKKKIEFSQINGGLKFKNGDAVSAEAINAPIEASAYAQEVAEEAKRIAEESGGGGTVDLSNYVQKTDYAGNGEGQAGIVRGFAGQYGLGQNETAKSAYIIRASDQEILAKKNQYRPITPQSLDLAVKTSVTTNTIDLSDDEKTSACEWLGAVKKATVAPQGFSIYGTDYQKTDTKVFSAFWTPDPGRVVMYGTADRRFNVETPINDTHAANKKYVDETVPVIYTDADENNTTKKLRIYTDNFGYLHIDTE